MSESMPIRPSQITSQVSRIVRTEQFRSSKILCDFLKFVVNETLLGNEKSLKEYVIATEVLKKSSDFNPQLDAVVRIHARRLRQVLDSYYSGPGLNDSIIISMPKGRYIPVFEKNIVGSVPDRTLSTADEAPIESIPSIAVFPFDCMGGKERGNVICSMLGRDITVALSHFDEVKVISFHSAEFARENLKNISEMLSHLGADYFITGSCMREKENLKVNVVLNHSRDHQILWAESMVIKDFDQNEINSYNTIVKNVVAKTCSFLGNIYRNKLNEHIPQDYNTLYAIYWHNRYHRRFTLEAFQEASKAIDKALIVNPDSALLTAFKGELLLNLCAMDVEGEKEFFVQGSALACRAIDLDKNNQHAWQVFAWAKLLEKNKLEYDKAAERCLAINPHNAMYIGSVGFGHQCAGRYEEGLELMLDSIDMNPFYPWQTNLGLCLYYLHKKEFEEAHYWAEMISRQGSLWNSVPCVATKGLLNKTDEATFAIEDLRELSPKIEERAIHIVGRFIFDPELQETILRGLAMAGIKIARDS